jgi:Putative transposase, YhgA-like
MGRFRDWYEKNGRRLPLPPVLPLLVHQGPQGWTFSTEFVSLFGNVPDPLRPYLPNFRHALVDLKAMGICLPMIACGRT